MANYVSKSKWAWQAYFMSNNHQILEKCLFFEALKMIIIKFVDTT